MPAERFFDNTLTSSSRTSTLESDEFTHATRVCRLGLHDLIEVINGKGLLAKGKITAIQKRHLEYEVLSSHQDKNPPPARALLMGMPKFNRLEFIIEKVCEIGCDTILLFNADFSEKLNLSENQNIRLHNLMIAALKQSGRLWMPTLELRPHLEACFESDRTYFFGDLDHPTPLEIKKLEKPVGIVIGPESGFSQEEVKLLRKKAQGITLGKATLRADTAAMSGLYLLSYFQDCL